MGVPRFYRVIRGQRGAAARTKYLAYLESLQSDIRDDGVQGSNRPASLNLAVVPFGIDLGTGKHILTSALQPSWNSAKTAAAVTLRTKEIGTGGVDPANVFKFKKVKAARAVARAKINAQGSVQTSRLTGLKYLRYNVSSFSFPFGKTGTTETQLEAFASIQSGLPTYKLTLVEEIL